jgi:hypothetical protein
MRSPVSGRGLALSAHAYAVVVALGLAAFMARIPLEINDSITNVLRVIQPGVWNTILDQFSSLRPLLWGAIAIAYELANGHYLAMYKGIHAVQLVASVILFVNLLRVRSVTGALAVPFGIAVLLGSHTFAVTVTEAYPINTFMTVVVCCLAAANLSFGRPAIWRDVAAIVIFALVLFTVETGALVWLILAGGWLLGWRGVSKWGLLGVTLVLCAYAYLRLSLPAVSAPSLALQTHASGFGFRVLAPAEQLALFGDRAWVLYGYNVLSQILTVLFAEPKGGVWIATQRLLAGELLPRDIIAVVSSTGATALIVWYMTQRVGAWRGGELSDGDRLVLLFAPILGANAVLSYSYLKDVIVSPAGVFHALAATVAFTLALQRLAAIPLRGPVAAVTAALLVLSAGWTARLVGLHYSLREKAFIVRNEWMWLGPEPANLDLHSNPEGRRLVRQLYYEAAGMRVAGAHFSYVRDGSKYFEIPW